MNHQNGRGGERLSSISPDSRPPVPQIETRPFSQPETPFAHVNEKRRKRDLAEVRESLVDAGSLTASDHRIRLLRGDFFDIGELQGNRLILSDSLAEDVSEAAEEFRAEHPKIKRFYFVQGNKTATEYDGTIKNRSTVTGIKTLSDGRRIFVIDPLRSDEHRAWDTRLRHWTGNPARKVSEAEWYDVFREKSRIPVLESREESDVFPYRNLIALPFIPNVNGVDFFANNHQVSFGESYEWAGEAGRTEKVSVAKNALHELSLIHDEGKAWGEPAAHNMLIADEGRNVIIVDPEVLYDDDVPMVERQARDVLDLVISITGAMRMSGDIAQKDYGTVVPEILSVYPDHHVIETAARVSETTGRLFNRLSYRFYEGLRMNSLPLQDYLQIAREIRGAA